MTEVDLRRLMDIEETIRQAVGGDLFNSYIMEYAPVSTAQRVNKIFHYIGCDSFWYALLDILTLGWYSSSRKAMIRQAITQEIDKPTTYFPQWDREVPAYYSAKAAG